MAFIGDVEVLVESEGLELVNEITEKPVESGQEVADHVRNLPATFSISGVVAGEDADQKFEQLQKYRNDKEVISFVGRQLVDNLVIQSLSPVQDNTILDGFKFTITFRQVRIAEVRTAEIVVPEVLPQAREVEDKGTDTVRTEEEDAEARRSALLKVIDALADIAGEGE